MNAPTLPRRPFGKTGLELSVIGLGGITVCGMEQAAANRLVAEAIDRGLNYFDVAPTYGDGEAEEKLGRALEGRRDALFLACKTTARDAKGARAELERSLRRLRTDRFDLYQFHGVNNMDDAARILAPGGAAETFAEARRNGLVRHQGLSAHNEQAALMIMRQFKCDSVLFPFNHVCWAHGFGPAVYEAARQMGVARLALKAMARTVKTQRPGKHPKCWYEPVEEPQAVRDALGFTLSLDLTAAIPPGEESLFRLALDATPDLRPLSAAERDRILEQARGSKPIFAPSR